MPRTVVVRWARTPRAPDDRAQVAEQSRRLLRRIVASMVGCGVAEVRLEQECPECGGPHGRPQVLVGARSGPHVSLARSDGLVVVAVAGREVGIDVERATVGGASVREVALSDQERDGLRDLSEPEAEEHVLRTWVRKEAVLKATGHGLRVEPSMVVLAERPIRIVRWAGPGRRPNIRVADVDLVPGYVAAVACRTRRAMSVDVRSVLLSGD